MLKTLLPIPILCLLLSLSPGSLFAQVAWTGPGPSANVKAFGAVGDLLVGNDGSGSMGVSSLNSSQTFTAGDMGKNLWIDEAPFPAPTFASNGILVDTGSGAMHCPGGGQFVNTATYPIHVYYRVTFINSAGTLEGNASVEGFASIPGSTSLMYCVKITSPTGAPTGAANYRVYFATDATPLPWVMRTYSVGQQILDPNGNIETVTVGGASGGSQPTWLGVGAITHDNVVRWLNQGPVVPGSGSGLEMLMSGTCGGTAGTLLGAGCEIDTLHAGTQSPPTPLVVNVGMITSVGPGNKLNWTGSPLPTAISGANFAWGHDDTTAITSAVTSLNNYVDSQSRVVGGTLFFPTSTGCYGIISNVAINATNSQFLGLTGEGSASSKMLGGPGTLPQQPASACIATIASSAGFTFSSDNGMLNAGPTVERLGFLDPFGVTATALKFNTNASTRVVNNSFQGYVSGKAIWFNAAQLNDTSKLYNQFVAVNDNVCISVQSCIVMNNG